MRCAVVGGLITEEVSGSLLTCGVSGTAVHRLSGDASRYFEDVVNGDGGLPDDRVTSALIAAGVVAPIADVVEGAAADAPVAGVPSIEMVSRRRAMALGAAALAAAGVVTVGLPSAAAAQSSEPDPDAFPSAPTGGNAGGAGGDYDPDDPVVNTNRYTLDSFLAPLAGYANVTWEVVTAVEPLTYAPVTFGYRFEAPPGTQRGTGTAEGATPNISVTGAQAGLTYVWYLTASSGEVGPGASQEGVQKILTGSFPEL